MPEELFVGREVEIKKVLNQGIRRVASGTTSAFFIEGEYGIGKTSVAQYLKTLAEKEHNLHGVYVSLGAAHTLEDLAVAILEATIQSGALSATKQGIIRKWMKKYIKDIKLFGVTLKTDALRADASSLSSIIGMLSFLREIAIRLEGEGVRGVMLILDEINGIASNPQFAHLLKGLIDQNMADKDPHPFLLMLCGTRERWDSLVGCHEPVGRIFRLIEIDVLEEEEVEDFFERSFASVGIMVEEDAMVNIVHFSAGYPRLMHLIGDCAYWQDNDGVIDVDDSMFALIDAADELGRKHIDRAVLDVIRSSDYHSILLKIGSLGLSPRVIARQDLLKLCSEGEKRKVDKFLRRMIDLNVLVREKQGEYVFTQRIIRLYLWLKNKYPNYKEIQRRRQAETQ